MKRRALFWLIFPYYLVIIVLSLVLVTVYAGRQVSDLYFEETTRALEVHARMINEQLVHNLAADSSLSIDSLCHHLGQITETRVTIVDSGGRVLGDSYQDFHLMENHRLRPEIAQALTGRIDSERRFSSTLHEKMLYVAVPWVTNGEIVGAVRTAVPITALHSNLSSMYEKMTLIVLIVALIAAAVSVVILRRVTRPLQQLQAGAARFARGNLESKLASAKTAEINDLVDAMNKMAADLDSRILTIAQKRKEQDVIFSSMTEGVLALDRSELIVELNRAAAELLGVSRDQALGRKLHEVIRNSRLYALVEQSFRDEAHTEMEIPLGGDTNRVLQVHSTALKDESDQISGVLLVFTDISRIKRLETIRRDFVANVSHELRTPITAITGSIETLLDNPGVSDDDSQRFLSIISKHTERLARIVEDLLGLARLENETEGHAIELRRERLSDILASSVAACRHKSDSKKIAVSVICDPQLEADVNAVQLEHAITNLVDNAIKYSDNDSRIMIEASQQQDEVLISVSDEGPGIEARHLPRLFERFYRVDSARSRDLGGTGLGLAIVKHIAIAHGGAVTVESTLGKGTTFQIHLPCAS